MAQIRHEIPSAFVAQSLIGLSTGYGVTRS
jgi:hypothetical protein